MPLVELGAIFVAASLSGVAMSRTVTTDASRSRLHFVRSIDTAAGSTMLLEPPTQDLSAKWEVYMQDLHRLLPTTQAVRVSLLWRSLYDRFGAALVPPRATPQEDGTFSMFWDSDRHHLEIELLPGGTYDWFYMDRMSSRRDGQSEVPLGVYSAEMINAFRITLGEQH